MWTLSRETYSASIGAATQHMMATFHTKSRDFDHFFTQLLTHSKRDFHFMFKKTYGILYERNSDVFTDFFKDLEAYYDSGNVDLEEALRKFFSHLYQRMFTVLNSQYSFDSRLVGRLSGFTKGNLRLFAFHTLQVEFVEASACRAVCSPLRLAELRIRLPHGHYRGDIFTHPKSPLNPLNHH